MVDSSVVVQSLIHKEMRLTVSRRDREVVRAQILEPRRERAGRRRLRRGRLHVMDVRAGGRALCARRRESRGQRYDNEDDEEGDRTYDGHRLTPARLWCGGPAQRRRSVRLTLGKRFL